MQWTRADHPAELQARVKDLAVGRIGEAINRKDKHERIDAVELVKREVIDAVTTDFPDNARDIADLVGEVEYHALRSQVLESGERVDGRKANEVRPITIQTGILPRAHGSALFTRGQTQALVVATLGTANDVQRLDTIDEPSETTKTFMLHYNFPPFSTGEVRPMRGTSRREIGHGNLAERALQPLLPDFEKFPYTIRVVSDILESNGSSSMASVCGGSLALFDAGVPYQAPVAGVAMGLIKEGDRYAILTDILGTEDHLGDMDFKVAGTETGITSIQMDIKIEGLDLKIMREALARAREGRLHILGEMNKALAQPRPDLSPYAPRIVTLMINPEKIGDLIGPKGKTIRGIQDETGAEITVEDTGLVTIAAVGGEAMEKARSLVQALTKEPEIGATYDAVVKSTTPFGAFVEILPGTEGLVHISELQHGRTEKTEDVVKKGDTVRVKLIDKDERGRLRLSMKALIPKPEGTPEQPNEGRGERQRGERPQGGGDREPAAAGAGSEAEPHNGGDGAESHGRPRSRRGGRSRR
jgi:polyribonucleotide nucleotidyltransferase